MKQEGVTGHIGETPLYAIGTPPSDWRNKWSGMPEETNNAVADGTEPVEANPTENASPKTFTTDEVEQIVKDRLAREQKKFAKERDALLKQSEVKGKELSPNVEEDLRGKLKGFEQKEKQLSERLERYRGETLRAVIERELNAQNCIDPEVAIDHFLSRKKVYLDDDDQVVVENYNGQLADLCKEFLATKPHLVRGTGATGAGTKGPKSPTNADLDPIAEFERIHGINRKQYSKR